MSCINIDEICKKIANDFGYELVSAEFSAFSHLKMRWTRSYKMIDFKISDYLKHADEKTIEEIVTTVLERIEGKGGPSYGPHSREYLKSFGFRETNRPKYLKRNRVLKQPEGEHIDLNENLRRLTEEGYIPEDYDLYVTWSDSGRKPTESSTLFRVISVSEHLDRADTDRNALDALIYEEFLKIRELNRTFGTEEEPDMSTVLEDAEKHPGYTGIEKMLRKALN